MIQNIGNSSFQYPQQIWMPNESMPEKQGSIRENGSFTYEAHETFEIQYVSLNSASDPSASLDLFFSNLKEALAGLIPFENGPENFPYTAPATPDGFAGRVLNRIQEQYMNREASMLFPDEAKALETEFSGAMPMEEPAKPAAVSGDIVQPATAEEAPLQTVVADEKQNFLDTVEKGVETGFRQTVSYLEQAVYREQSTRIVKEADQLIRKGLQSLRNDHSERSRGAEERLVMRGVNESKDFHLEIMTRDGDRVSMDINSEMMSESVRYQYGDNGQKIRGREYSGLKNDLFALSVQGELDQDELAAISDLITEIASLAEMFYAGNYADAISHAVNLGMNPDELSGFTLDLTHEQSVYETLMTPDRPVSGYQNTEYGNPAPENYMGALAEGFANLADHRAFAFFEKPFDIFQEIFLKFKDRFESGPPDETHQNPEPVVGLMEKAAMVREGNAEQTGTGRFQQPSNRKIDYFL